MMSMQIEKCDYFGQRGCCKTCNIEEKENVRGLQRDIWFEGKHFDCLCLDGKCKKCSWYFNQECQHDEEGLYY